MGCKITTRKLRLKSRYISWGPSKPLQLIKHVWGLGAHEHCIDLTIINDNSTLMDMDAPMVMPAGSMLRRETPSDDAVYVSLIERVVHREIPIHRERTVP